MQFERKITIKSRTFWAGLSSFLLFVAPEFRNYVSQIHDLIPQSWIPGLSIASATLAFAAILFARLGGIDHAEQVAEKVEEIHGTGTTTGDGTSSPN